MMSKAFVPDVDEDLKLFTAYYNGEANYVKLMYAARSLVGLPGAVVTRMTEDKTIYGWDCIFSITILHGQARGNYSFHLREVNQHYRAGITFEYIDVPAMDFLSDVLPDSHTWDKNGRTPWGGNFPKPEKPFVDFIRKTILLSSFLGWVVFGGIQLLKTWS